MNGYRTIREMSADELLALLTEEPQYQIELFVRMGGDPHDHHYAFLSLFTRELRLRGLPVHSSRKKGVWIGEIREPQLALDLEGVT